MIMKFFFQTSISIPNSTSKVDIIGNHNIHSQKDKSYFCTIHLIDLNLFGGQNSALTSQLSCC